MSLPPHELEPIPETTRRLMQKACPNGTVVSRLRDALGPIYHDEDFADLFPKRGRPAEAPWRLALVLVLQAMENLTDRQAAQAVCLRLDWKYALSLARRQTRALTSAFCVTFGSGSSASRPSSACWLPW